jgi:type VI secretion system protein ImpH
MKSNELKNSLHNNYDTDFKAEVIAAEMVENGIPSERIVILMSGAQKRPYRKDVDTIAEELSDYDHKEYFTVKTPKEGIYDMLPEGLFHFPGSHNSAKTDKEIIDSIKRRREEERNARRFFLPFEAAIRHLSIQMALYENEVDKRSQYDELIKIFFPHWRIFQYLDNRQADLFIHLLPIIHNIRDDHKIIEEILELIFLLPVNVSIRSRNVFDANDAIISKLGNTRLGVDFTTGNDTYDDGEDEILISIGPIDGKQFQHFIPGATGTKILELLCDYLLPVNIDIITQFELKKEDKRTKLYDGENEMNCTLGVNTYL